MVIKRQAISHIIRPTRGCATITSAAIYPGAIEAEALVGCLGAGD